VKKKHWSDKLVAMGACKDVLEWAKNYRSATQAWKDCQRGTWLEWCLIEFDLEPVCYRCTCMSGETTSLVCLANHANAIRAQYPTPPKKKAGA
jgi:hypothetical protein